MPLSAGDKLGPFEILSHIGEGGMGEVFSALDTRLGRKVAIKISRERFSRRFEREAQAISALNHPNICTLYDVGNLPDGGSYMVTELVEGETLREWLKRAPGLDRGLAVMRQVIHALGAAHQAGVIHRDLKPANIMVRFDGYAKVLDFGLAKRIPAVAPRSDDTETIEELSASGQIVGTIAYMSPEQILGQEADARSDLFAVGIILYEIAAGRRPWSGLDSAIDSMHAILHDDPAPANAPAAIDRIIRRCLAKQPGLRFQNMAELETALDHAAADPTASPADSSIAVLAFTNMSGDKENEYFSDGLAEEIINELAKMPGLKVAAPRSSFYFKAKDVEFAEIGKRLNVAHILEGSVRKAGSRVRITVQLIKLRDGFHLWSERYDREMTDIFAIQDEITQAIAAVLRVKLSVQPTAVKRYAPDLRAYDTYLKARDLWFKGSRPELLLRYKELLEHAIELDPKFALAHAYLGMYYTMQANFLVTPSRDVIPLAIASEEQALRVDPELAEAHALLACCIGSFKYDWNGAERHWRQAMAREPVSRDVLLWYGNHHLLVVGRMAEAIDAMERGLEGDPLNLLYRHVYARGLRLAGRLDEAETELRKILEIDPDYAHALGTFGSLCAQLGRTGEALSLTEKAHASLPHSAMIAGQLAAIHVRAGNASRVESLIGPLRNGDICGAPTGMAVFHALCGELDQAVLWAERAIDDRELPFVQNLGPFLRNTRSWASLTKRMNLPG
jgi:eukaryotic-like serine/threonine-protein kinase